MCSTQLSADEGPTLKQGISQRLLGRFHRGVRKPSNWVELFRFGLVGVSGYIVNLLVYSILIRLAVDFRLAAVGAFIVALANNFIWNRRWTFHANDGALGFQVPRFLAVSLMAFACNLLFLELLVRVAGLAEIPGQAIAVALAMPANFLGNKYWSFRIG